MKNELKLFDEILHGSLRPWLKKNQNESRFRDQLLKLEMEKSLYPMTFQIHFLRPFSSKTRYYRRLITNEVIRICNKVHRFIEDDNIQDLYVYHRNFMLHKSLPVRLTEVGKVIFARDYFWEFFDPNEPFLEEDFEFRNDAFILQFLKTSLIHVFMELQEMYRFIDAKDLLIEKDFYPEFFKDAYPEKLFIENIKEHENDQPQVLSDLPPSFGMKERDMNRLKLIIEHLTYKIALLDTDKCSLKNAIGILTSKDLSQYEAPIYLNCETSQFRYVLDKLKPMFTDLTLISIERSKLFYSKNGVLLRASNLSRIKSYDPKDQELIDDIFRYVKI